MKEIIVSLEKPDDLEWSEFSLLVLLEEIPKDQLDAPNTLTTDILYSLEKKGYIRIFKEEIIVTDKFTNIDNKSKDITEIINHLSTELGLSRGLSTKSNGNRKFVSGRLNDGYTKEDIKDTISYMVTKWKNDYKMRAYLRIKTLLNSENFEGYFSEMQLNGKSDTNITVG